MLAMQWNRIFVMVEATTYYSLFHKKINGKSVNLRDRFSHNDKKVPHFIPTRTKNKKKYRHNNDTQSVAFYGYRFEKFQ